MTDFDDINESMDQYINKLLLNISPEMHMHVPKSTIPWVEKQGWKINCKKKNLIFGYFV